jgi:hypothetical protein
MCAGDAIARAAFGSNLVDYLAARDAFKLDLTSIALWNDNRSRTKGEVLHRFDVTIARLSPHHHVTPANYNEETYNAARHGVNQDGQLTRERSSPDVP